LSSFRTAIGCHIGRHFRVTVTDTEEEGNVTVVHGEGGAAGTAGGSAAASGAASGAGSEAGSEPDAWLAERFQEQRGRLRAVAYRMLGSLEEADDAVQNAWLRCSTAGADDVLNLGGWLTTIVSRICLNTLRSRAARPETLASPRIPDPVLSPADGPTPEQETEPDGTVAAQRAIVDAFFAAARAGDLRTLQARRRHFVQRRFTIGY
jgi:DNA-directed RNA polymerase specialized sigma24 family protein